jgi:Diaminopimelate epimerase
MSKLRIGYTCNARDATRAGDERYNEWEPPETVDAVGSALVDAGCEVSVIEVGADTLHPDGLHVNFVRVREDASLEVQTYEAGVEDVTPACGTGSTAVAYVCARTGRTTLPVTVRLFGGQLVIDAQGDSMMMRGPAEYMRPFMLEWSAGPASPGD